MINTRKNKEWMKQVGCVVIIWQPYTNLYAIKVVTLGHINREIYMH